MQLGEIAKRPNIQNTILGAGVCLTLFLGVVYLINVLEPVSSSVNPEQVLFEIKAGDGYRHIVSDLKEKGLIKSEAAFKLLSLITGAAVSLKPGAYHLNPSMSSPEILLKLLKGAREEIAVTVPEGFSVYDIDRLLAGAGILKAGELVEADKKNPLEGRLFPDTYKFFMDSDVESVVGKFLATFKAKAGPLLKENRTSTLILASLLEKEVPDFEERKIVAGILLKRMEARIPLQVDATICYIKEIRSFPKPAQCYPLSRLDFQIESSYNTYVKLGLPPGPIGNPGLTAIVAAVHPKSSPFWYYLSDPATQKTIFSRDLDEQEANRVKYLSNPKNL